jgi:diaminohydroxyphosphoribosylaminopyrimidine deaminase/5-amino-6-(5-phosphoribosylamino)uracil reductase
MNPAENSNKDHYFLAHTLRLAERNLGNSGANPSVGCVIVNPEGLVVAAAVTGKNGRPHAEALALAQAGAAACAATVYVTLEPCVDFPEKTSAPCTKALISAKVARVVIGKKDPFKPVCGQGILALKAAGIEVTEIYKHKEIQAFYAPYTYWQTTNFPWISLKLATSLDGKMALSDGTSKWLTSAQSRRVAQLHRAKHQAILTGIGTVLVDDPLLNCRIEGMAEYSPARIILDANLRIPLNSKLVKTAAEIPLIIYTTNSAKIKEYKLAQELESKGIRVIPVIDSAQNKITPAQIINQFADDKFSSVYIEAGAQITSEWLAAIYTQKIFWWHAPCILGQDAKAVSATVNYQDLEEAKIWKLAQKSQFGDDSLSIFERKESDSNIR